MRAEKHAFRPHEQPMSLPPLILNRIFKIQIHPAPAINRLSEGHTQTEIEFIKNTAMVFLTPHKIWMTEVLTTVKDQTE